MFSTWFIVDGNLSELHGRGFHVELFSSINSHSSRVEKCCRKKIIFFKPENQYTTCACLQSTTSRELCCWEFWEKWKSFPFMTAACCWNLSTPEYSFVTSATKKERTTRAVEMVEKLRREWAWSRRKFGRHHTITECRKNKKYIIWNFEITESIMAT